MSIRNVAYVTHILENILFWSRVLFGLLFFSVYGTGLGWAIVKFQWLLAISMTEILWLHRAFVCPASILDFFAFFLAVRFVTLISCLVLIPIYFGTNCSYPHITYELYSYPFLLTSKVFHPNSSILHLKVIHKLTLQFESRNASMFSVFLRQLPVGILTTGSNMSDNFLWQWRRDMQSTLNDWFSEIFFFYILKR